MMDWQSLLRAISDPAMVLDAENRIVAVNEAIIRETGKAREQLTGCLCHDIFHDQPPHFELGPYRSLLETCQASPSFIKKDNPRKVYEVKVFPLFDQFGELEYMLHIAHDIADKHSDEKALLKRVERNRSFLELTQDGFCLLDTELRVVEVNRSLCTMLGYCEAELLGKTIYELVSDENLNVFLTQCAKIPTSKHRSQEITLRRKDDSPVYTIINATAITWCSGEVKGYFCLVTDITENIRLKGELVQSRKMATLGTLAGGIAHDFNNILAAIIGCAEIARLNLPEKSHVKKEIDNVIIAGKRAAELVRQILTFSRKADPTKVPVRLDLLVRETLNLIRATLPASIEITASIDLPQSIIQADPTSIHQVIMNLCTNALDAMEGKKGNLKIELSRIWLDRRQVAEKPDVERGWFVVLTVQDNGMGMDDTVITKMFNPYFTTKELGKGTGLGLTMSHGIIKGCKGFIDVESVLGSGTTFRLYFPAFEEQECEGEIQQVERELPTGNEHILIIDDEPAITRFIQLSLTHLGYRVTALENSTKALELFRRAPDSFNLVFTDQTMPELTGTELAREMLSLRPDIPILLCSGYSATISEVDTAAIGIRRLLTKPLTTKLIAETIRQVLDEQQ